MQDTLCMNILWCLSENGFSLDELVFKTKEMFETKGVTGFVEFILKIVDYTICMSAKASDSKWAPEACCGGPVYHYFDRRRRSFRTSIGLIKIKWRRMKCRNCGRTVIPLKEFMGIGRYQSKTVELERIVAEVVSEQSYRRSSHHMNIIGDIPVPKSTAHRWVMQSDCDEIKIEGKVVDSLFADGTGYKRRPNAKEGISNRGELKVVMGIRNDGQTVPFGCWSDEKWKDIGREIKKRSIETGPLSKVLISDGEPGLSSGLADLSNDQQRSHWHMIRDLGHMMWLDDGNKFERNKMKKHLRGIIGIEIPKEDFKKISDAHKNDIEHSTIQAEEKLDILIKSLFSKGYDKAARYVRSAKDKLFTYIRLWFKYGLISPRASSMIERMMREIGRRIKKIAFGWSSKGCAKIARIILKRFTDPKEWDKYWKNRLRINDNVLIAYRGIKIETSPHPILGR